LIDSSDWEVPRPKSESRDGWHEHGTFSTNWATNFVYILKVMIYIFWSKNLFPSGNDCFSFSFQHSSVFSWFGAEVVWEQVLHVVVGVVSIVKFVWLIWDIVSSVVISSVGVTIEINNQIIWIVFEFNLLVVISVSVGELIRVLLVHLMPVFWDTIQLKKSHLSSSISASAESEVFNNFIFWISSILDFFVISGISITKPITGLLNSCSGIEHCVQLSIGHGFNS